MKSRSAKNKGQRLAKEFKQAVDDAFKFRDGDVEVQPSGVPGMDIRLSPYARDRVPFAVECKNQETLPLWKSLQQAEENATEQLKPLLVFRRNRSETYACLKLSDLISILTQLPYSPGESQQPDPRGT